MSTRIRLKSRPVGVFGGLPRQARPASREALEYTLENAGKPGKEFDMANA
jgi:hypothetical protein